MDGSSCFLLMDNFAVWAAFHGLGSAFYVYKRTCCYYCRPLVLASYLSSRLI